ncbi:MAG: hypothetical protein J5528_04825 [Firmicutes bacterium]|nr:hypothetical protein [Bacillota bacterium]
MAEIIHEVNKSSADFCIYINIAARYSWFMDENFFASLKKKYFYRREYATIDDVRKDLFYSIPPCV